MIHIIYIIYNSNASTRPSDLVFEDVPAYSISLYYYQTDLIIGILEYVPLHNEEKTFV